MSYIKQNWVACVAVLSFVLLFAVSMDVVHVNSSLSSSVASSTAAVEKIQGTVGALNILAAEELNTARGGSIASSTDFVSAVYQADMQIQQQLQQAQQQSQQSQQQPSPAPAPNPTK
jgi:hypothetical protein